MATKEIIQLGQIIRVSSEYRRVEKWNSSNMTTEKTWVAEEVKVYDGIVIGIRYLQNGESSWLGEGMGNAWVPRGEYIKVLLVVKNLRQNPKYVPIPTFVWHGQPRLFSDLMEKYGGKKK